MNKEPSRQSSPETWEMLARYLAGESSSEESARVRQWLAADPSRVSLMQALGDSLDRLPDSAAADVDVEAALSRVKARRFQERTSNAWRTNLLRAAAVVAIVLGGSVIWQSAASHRNDKVVASAQVFRSLIGKARQLTLSDSTRVILGPGSELTVAAGYGTKERDVQLTGEALFDVVHDSSRPFAVRAGNAVIHDVGTTFAVRSNSGEPVHVAVTAGSVVLHAKDKSQDQGVVLRAGQHGVLQKDGQVLAQQSHDDDLAWTRGELVFDDASLEHVAGELNRWYGIKMRIADSSLTSRHVTASFKGESRDQVLRIIGLTLGARIELNGDTAIVHSH